MFSKKRLRKQLRTQRSALSVEETHRLSDLICNFALLLPLYPIASSVALYWPTHREVDTERIRRHLWRSGRSVFLPVAYPGGKMTFVALNSGGAVARSTMGIMEPTHRTSTVDANELDLIFLPLVGFDRTGARLGYGGGYYDRYLTHRSDQTKRPHLVGLAYGLQETDTVPSEPHDVRLDAVITEEGVRWFKTIPSPTSCA